MHCVPNLLLCTMHPGHHFSLQLFDTKADSHPCAIGCDILFKIYERATLCWYLRRVCCHWISANFSTRHILPAYMCFMWVSCSVYIQIPSCLNSVMYMFSITFKALSSVCLSSLFKGQLILNSKAKGVVSAVTQSGPFSLPVTAQAASQGKPIFAAKLHFCVAFASFKTYQTVNSLLHHQRGSLKALEMF